MNRLTTRPASSSRRWALVLAATGLLAASYYAGLWRWNYPARKRFPVRGIDVSSHQRHISWFTLSLNGVDFAYLKATEGTDFKDREFAYNWDQSAKSGVPRGAYHFFNLCRSGRDQARNFLATVPEDPRALPPALDLEFSDSCRRTPSRTEFQREVSRFVAACSRRFPGPPVFYVTPDIYRRYFEGHRQEFPPHRLWIRNVLKEPSQAPCSEWTFWQFADHGRIEGIRGPVDLNVFCGSREELALLTGGSAKRSPAAAR